MYRDHVGIRESDCYVFKGAFRLRSPYLIGARHFNISVINHSLSVLFENTTSFDNMTI